MKALVIVELDGGNDGLNTVIPFADPRYFELRPTLAIARDRILRLDARTGLHPSLAPLMSAWRTGQLAIVQGVGDPMPNRSHFRSQQIWRSASAADEYRDEAWLAQANGGANVIARGADREAFVTAARDVASHRDADGVKVIHLMLHGFDTHENQSMRHAALLAQLAQGLAILHIELMRAGDWHRTLVMSVSEFGRSAYENESGGTGHGTASVQFVMGGCVRGGFYGEPPRLNALDEEGRLRARVDFRRLVATALDACGRDLRSTHVDPLPILRA